MYPVSYAADPAIEGRNRLTTFFRYLIAIPWLFVAALYGFVAQFAALFAWFAIVFTGRYPQGLYDFNAGYLRMLTRVNSYTYLMTDELPSFGGEAAPDYPIAVGIAPPLDAYSRVKTFFRLIVGIPVMLLAYVQTLILSVVTLVAWFAILFTGKFPEGLFNPARSANAYLTRAGSYFLLMTEDWPPFSLDAGEGESAGAITATAASREVKS
ncbi:DUF4389 domain-containing protein [soil metagenome]